MSLHGWEHSVWNDDNLSSKKLFPKYQFPSRSRVWQARTKVTEESMYAAVQHLQKKHDLLRNSSTKKSLRPDVNAVEEVSLKAAVCFSLMNEFLSVSPVDKNKVASEWIHKWAEGDAKVDIELDTLLMNRDDKLDVRLHIPTFKRLSDAHVFQRPVSQPKHEESQLMIDAFNLELKQLEYDVQCFKTWLKKMGNVESAREHVTLKWKRDRRLQALEAADLALSSCSRLVVWPKKVERAIQEVMTFKRNVMEIKLGLDNSCGITQLVYYNCSAPCLITAENMQNGLEMMTWCLSDQLQSLGILVSPTFSYNRGHVFLEEKAILDKLARNNVNLDWTCSILFGSKVDARDQRPMAYQARLIFASPLDLLKNVWFSCELRKTQRTAEVAQMNPSKMREVENLAEDSLPDTTDERQRVRGASKYSQLGVEACQQILAGALQGSTYETIGPGVLILDLNVMTGDMYQAFLNQRASNAHCFFMGFCEDQNQASYVEQISKEELADKFMAGSPLPSGEKLDLNAPSDLLENLPDCPRLNLLAPLALNSDFNYFSFISHSFA